jgi:hypothetical protein
VPIDRSTAQLLDNRSRSSTSNPLRGGPPYD